jgi:hypothetical protein
MENILKCMTFLYLPGVPSPSTRVRILLFDKTPSRKKSSTVNPTFSFNVVWRGQAGRQADMQAGRQTGRQTDRQTDRQADRQTDRQTDRQKGEKKADLGLSSVEILRYCTTACSAHTESC